MSDCVSKRVPDGRRLEHITLFLVITQQTEYISVDIG
jgi:hypothetical protein